MSANIKYFVLILIGLIQFNCTGGKFNKPVYEVSDPSHGLKSYIMTGNNIVLKGFPKEYTSCALNPGRIASKNNRIYYIINLVYRSEIRTVKFSESDTLYISLDNSQINLVPYDVQSDDMGASIFYEIDRYDIVDIGNAKKVQIKINVADDVLTSDLSYANIYNFQRFATRYILVSDHIPEMKAPEPVTKWGFTSFGFGSGYEIWLGKYTNLITAKKKIELSDYLAFSIGTSSFSYEILGFRQFWEPVEGNPNDSVLTTDYWVDESIAKYYPYIGAMYGISVDDFIRDWSLEAGLTLQYFFLPSWQQDSDSIYVPEHDQYYAQTIYRQSGGNLFDGFSAGIFMQIGGLWARINTKKSWAIGLVLPVPWW